MYELQRCLWFVSTCNYVIGYLPKWWAPIDKRWCKVGPVSQRLAWPMFPKVVPVVILYAYILNEAIRFHLAPVLRWPIIRCSFKFLPLSILASRIFIWWANISHVANISFTKRNRDIRATLKLNDIDKPRWNMHFDPYSAGSILDVRIWRL